MLNLVEVRTAQGTLLSLPLADVSDGLVIEEIDGLDPVKATLVSSSFALMDGQQYQSARRESRNIKFKIGLEPDYVTQSVRDLRKNLYNFFMPKSLVTLTFWMDDGLNATIQARVESFETALFSKEPAVDISLMAFNPDFYDPDLVTFSGSTTATAAETLVNYPGTVETGVLFTLNVNRTLTDFSIYHRPPDNTVRSLQFSAALAAADVLKINTQVGSKAITLTRAGSDSSLLYGMSPQSYWITLQPGDNYIRFYAVGAAIPFTMTYNTKYGGL